MEGIFPGLTGNQAEHWTSLRVRKEQKQMKKRTRNKDNKHSISVSGKLYAALCAVVPHGGVACFVDEAVVTALDDPDILERLVARCRGSFLEASP